MSPLKLSHLWAAALLVLLAGAAFAQLPATTTRAIVDGVTLPLIKSWPSADEVYAAWPADARRLGVEGSASVRCVFDQMGRTRDCAIENESYAGLRFGTAALELASKVTAEPALGRDGQPVNFSQPLTFSFVCRDRCMKLDPETLRRPLVVRAIWATAPTAEDVRTNYPAQLLESRLSGDAVLSCQFAPDNRLRNCKVGFEQPSGMGVGRAALALSAKFMAKPSTTSRAGYEIRLPFHFEMNNGRLMTGAPEVIGGPTSQEFRAAFPGGATASSGQSRLDCMITANGALNDCSVQTEAPNGQGFAAAALGISGKFLFNLWTPDGTPAVSGRVIVPIQFDRPPPPLTDIPYRVENPVWLRMPTPVQLFGSYPDRALRMAQDGRAVIDCEVTQSGDVINCAIVSETPRGFGFGQAALRLSQHFKMRPMVVGPNTIMPSGSKVQIPIEFKAQ